MLNEVILKEFSRWIAIRSEGLASAFYGGLAAYLVYGGSVNASGIGFTLAMAGTALSLHSCADEV